MCVGLGDAFDRMNTTEYQLRQRVLVRNFHDGNDVRLSPAGVDGLYLLDLPKRPYHSAGLSGLYVY